MAQSSAQQAFPSPDQVKSSNLGSHALNPANQLIPGGIVQLNQTDNFNLKDLPDEAKAEVLWFPKSGGEIFRDGPDSLVEWNNEIKNIRNINENHEFHAYGKLIQGEDIVNKTNRWDPQPHNIYNTERAQCIVKAWEKASSTNKNVMTGAALPTAELIRGYGFIRARYSYYLLDDKKHVSNNLRDQMSALNKTIAEQNKKNGIKEETGLIITHTNDDPVSYLVSQLLPYICDEELGESNYCIYLDEGRASAEYACLGESLSRPCALHVLAPQ